MENCRRVKSACKLTILAWLQYEFLANRLVILNLEVIIADAERSLLDNTQSDVSEREQICCVDNAPDNQNLKFAPPKFPKPPLKNEKKANRVMFYGGLCRHIRLSEYKSFRG